MESTQVEIKVIEQTAEFAQTEQMANLQELRLAWSGGGLGEVVAF